MAPDTGPSGPSPPKSGLALYANLLDPSSNKNAPGTISRAPVVFKQPSADLEAQPEDAAAAAKQKALNIGT
jgi:splicing factor 45